MSKTEKFFRAMAWLFLGVVIGFLIAPIKGGTNVTIASNNVGADSFDFSSDDDNDDGDGDDGVAHE